MDELTAHYNKFNEDKRLMRRHGQVEYITSMKYIHKYLEILQGENAKDTTYRFWISVPEPDAMRWNWQKRAMM